LSVNESDIGRSRAHRNGRTAKGIFSEVRQLRISASMNSELSDSNTAAGDLDQL
jgi:hypothetical protein